MNEVEGASSLMAIAIAGGFLVAVVVLLLPSGDTHEHNPYDQSSDRGPIDGWIIFGALLLGVVVAVMMAGF